MMKKNFMRIFVTLRNSNSETLSKEATTTYVNMVDMKSKGKSVELYMTSPSDLFFKWIAGFNIYKFEDFQVSLEYVDGTGDEGYAFSTI